MSKTITPSTYVRNLNHGMFRKLADFLDPQEDWKKIAVNIQKPSGEPRYNQFHLRRFEQQAAIGKSPTSELLYDWGTTNCTVGDLVDILVQNQLLSSASLLLPGFPVDAVKEAPVAIRDSQEAQTIPVGRTVESYAPDSTTQPEEEDFDGQGFSRFSFQELRKLTCNFDERPVSKGGNKLGEGGFGVVYRACIDKKVVAVKKLTMISDLSLEELKLQFKQEIQAMKMLKHENLVEMIGFSYDGDHPCLVFDYMSNGSLLDRLACLDGTPPLPWSKRCSIAVGTARGIEYLHTNHHIHRDIKSGNILLDKMFVAKISDFGLSRASAKLTSTVMTETIVGTTAYMSPEALRGEITPKSDIFSFGVVLLEIISGHPPVDENRDPKFLVSWKDEIEDEEISLEEFVDKKIKDWDFSSVENMYFLASQCLNERKNKRPEMKEVHEQLEDIQATPS
ncbi:interleukin-1 receptor-associated kinase 4 isoform X1 [Lepisosteus oculatus]|uniref:interleukin-1 receptor-associated kinase 4 isoform X1 n=1 Tax=Lepisosteus oculatus TaxID=7918 RepID=UPI00371B1A68